MVKIRFTLLSAVLLLMSTTSTYAQEATWIWYPGDYDIWLANNMQNRRTERGTFFPPFWKTCSHYNLVELSKRFELVQPEEVEIAVEGQYNVKLDGKMLQGAPDQILIGTGQHSLHIKVFNQQTPPAVYVNGKTIVSDGSWRVTYEDKEWIDESGKTSDNSATLYVNAASWNFNTANDLPSAFELPTKPSPASDIQREGNSIVADFGKETFGFVKFHRLQGSGNVQVYYGESKEEALSKDHCETLDQFHFDEPVKTDFTVPKSTAFRYVNIVCDAGISLDSVSMLYEFMPEKVRGEFRCSDEQINKIWDVAKYTFELNTREFFIDGIKRDRWIWSGDAYQSYLMNYYLFFDRSEVSRTLAALRGKDPVTSHINTIMDYTFYWFLGIYDYYMYTGDETFIRTFYPRMVSLMDYCLGRRNANGMMEGLAGDWVYVDWAPMDKNGEVSFEQILFCRSLETMALCAEIVKDQTRKAEYTQIAAELRSKLIPAFWNDQKGCFINNRVNGVQSESVTRYSNMFAVLAEYTDSAKTASIRKNVLLNDQVQKITTPYMRFYELEALCALGEHKRVTQEMKAYWGGMLRAGATSFWEKYDPTEEGTQQYAMYGRSFGKSLCHAWGASPIYLLGKYYLGVKPLTPGYETYLVEPALGGLAWIEGIVPMPEGNISVNAANRLSKYKRMREAACCDLKALQSRSAKRGRSS